MFPYVNNIMLGQVNNCFNLFSTIINDFDLILEIGTHRGGFSTWLFLNKNKNCKFKTYEIDERVIEIPKSSEIDIMITDCFSDECKNDIKNLIQTHGKTLLLCDGGHKNEEFIFYSKFFKKNDVIMLHDYMETNEEYKIISKNNNWPYGPESSYDAIKNAIVENNLSRYKYDEFKQILWGSFIKNF